ncbi:MAG: 2Fe-2S iron-sulfur cluster-binding protein [bacterium]|nr:2Fe-2S iron-sulfur cluster-binding protein [bacterium]
MPTVTVEGYGAFEVEAGRRLVRALLENGVDILHVCGGFARCTTCRVEFTAGEPMRMTAAERARLQAQGWLGQVRLSCQIEVDQAMTVEPVLTERESGFDDAGPEPAPLITPSPEWVTRPTH